MSRSPRRVLYSRGCHGIADAVCDALETPCWCSISQLDSTVGSAFTPSFFCLRHPASAKLGHPSPKDRLFLWEAALVSHVESIAEHASLPKRWSPRSTTSKPEVATLARAWADCEARRISHGLATVATSLDRRSPPIGEAVLKTMIRRCIRWLIAVRLLCGRTHHAHARTD